MVINVSPVRRVFAAGSLAFAMVYADLHVHTDTSDGQLSLEAVPQAAREAGVSVVAVTDHDRANPGLESPVVERAGVRIIHGIELRVAAPEQRVDLLGYGLDPTPELESEIDRLGADRRERGRRIRDCLEAELGVALDVTVDEHTGRPHLARAVLSHPDTAYDDGVSVFQDLIGRGQSCFEPRAVPSFERGVSLLKDAARFVGLAHPFRYDDPAAALELCAELDAVERYYPYDRPTLGDKEVDTALLDATIETHDLLATGGSDAHGAEIGAAGLDREAFGPVAAALSIEP